MKFVIVTGMSGAGKSTALKMLEDMGYFCVDNLPIALLPKFAELAHAPGSDISQVAVGVDIRNGRSLDEMASVLENLKASGVAYQILYLGDNGFAVLHGDGGHRWDRRDGILLLFQGCFWILF